MHTLNNPSAPRAAQAPRRTPRQTRTERLYASLNGSASSPALNAQFNVVGAAKASQGITIKGLAGPYIVMAKNFAQGTTTEDIESAMTPVGGVCLSCRIVTERPTLIAEIMFESKEGADNVVSTFNNQNVSIFGLWFLFRLIFSGGWQSPPSLPQSRYRSQSLRPTRTSHTYRPARSHNNQ